MKPNEYYSYFPEDKDKYIVIDFFLFLSSRQFKRVLQNIIDEVGYGDDAVSIDFPSTYEKWEEEYFEEGVKITVREKELIVSDEIFLKYANIAMEVYLKNHPEDAIEVNELYSKINDRFSKKV